MNSLFHSIQLIAKTYPDKTAIQFENTSCTYEMLVEQIEETKKLLVHNGISPKSQRVILSGVNSINLIVLFLSLMDLEIDIVLIDPKTSKNELNTLLESVTINYLLFEQSVFIDYFSSAKKFLTYHLVKLDNLDIVKNETTVYFFSTGTTGNPKVFGFSEKKITQKVMNLASHLQFEKNDNVLCPVSFTHSHGFVMTMPFLLIGATVNFMLPKIAVPVNIIKTIQSHKITIITGVPYQYNVMVESNVSATALKSLRYAFCGSAPMSEYLANRFEEKFSMRLNQAYGVSEIGPICVNLFEERKNNFLSVGKVIKNISYKIVDENDIEVLPGNEGELLVKSEYMTAGYLNADNNQLFREGWMCTQDIVREDEYKNIYIIGRKSNFINVSGYKVFPVEIEKVLLSIKGVKDTVVVGIEDEKRTQVIRAYISTFFPINSSVIKDFCKVHLSTYKIPHEIIFTDDLPTNSIGKVIKSKIDN